MEIQDVISSLSGVQKRIAGKILHQERISPEEGILLFREFDLSLLGMLANHLNRKMNGNLVYFNRNIHLEPTNICIHSCRFCSYSRKLNQEGAWEMSLEEIRLEIEKTLDSGITEVHIVGGVDPQRNAEYYAGLLQLVRETNPKLHIKAFTAAEIDHMGLKAGKDIGDTLQLLSKAGLDSIPGGGAEIFDETIRKEICPDKSSSERWLTIHETAHNLGIPSNATMLYGHIEKHEHRIDHLRRLRELQDRTLGFNAFIPLKYRNRNNELSDIGEVSYLEDLKTFAISRIFLDNIPHIKVYWPMIGKDLARLILSFGADDLDGTIEDTTRIYSMAGAEEQSPAMTVDEIIRIIKDLGRKPVERDSVYNILREY